jgi:hypothetical protein
MVGNAQLRDDVKTARQQMRRRELKNLDDRWELHVDLSGLR